jgi:hypothetical protein
LVLPKKETHGRVVHDEARQDLTEDAPPGNCIPRLPSFISDQPLRNIFGRDDRQSQRGNSNNGHAALLAARSNWAEVFEFCKSARREETPAAERFLGRKPKLVVGTASTIAGADQWLHFRTKRGPTSEPDFAPQLRPSLSGQYSGQAVANKRLRLRSQKSTMALKSVKTDQSSCRHRTFLRFWSPWR